MTIYERTGYEDFDRDNVIRKVNEISEELSKEQGKPLAERDRKKEQDLMWQMFYRGLRLSTGSVRFL